MKQSHLLVRGKPFQIGQGEKEKWGWFSPREWACSLSACNYPRGVKLRSTMEARRQWARTLVFAPRRRAEPLVEGRAGNYWMKPRASLQVWEHFVRQAQQGDEVSRA